MSDTQPTPPATPETAPAFSLPRIPLPFLGLAAYRAWLNMAFSGELFGNGPAFFPSQNAFDLTITLTMLVFILLARRLTPLYTRRWPRIACALLLVASSTLGLLPLWDAVPSSPALLLASTLCGGLGISLAILLWAEMYGRLTPVRICLYYAASIAVATGLSWMYEGFKTAWLPIMVPLLPLVSMAFLNDCYRDNAIHPTEQNTWVRFSFPWKPVAVIAVYSFAYGLMQSSFSSVMRPVMSLGTVACALCVVIVIMLLGNRMGFSAVYATLLPLMIAVTLLLASLGDLPPVWRNFCANWGHTASAIFIMVMLGSICYHWGVSAVWLFAIENVVTTPAQVLGRLADGWLASVGIGVAPVVIVMVMVATVVVLRECRLSSSWGVELVRDQPASQQARAAEERAELMRTCTALAVSHALSQREEEVLLLLAQHKSAGEIGTELCIAHGTAKAHIRHVYQKLDIHSREDLFELVGKARDV